MRDFMIVFLIVFSLAGCSTATFPPKVEAADFVGARITDKISEDLQATVNIASKYGAPDIAQCATYLQGAISGSNALLAEPTPGLISKAVQLYLLRQQGVKNEAAFRKECGPFAAGLILEAAKNAPAGGQLLR